jgi:hypothetical protein
MILRAQAGFAAPGDENRDRGSTSLVSPLRGLLLNTKLSRLILSAEEWSTFYWRQREQEDETIGHLF